MRWAILAIGMVLNWAAVMGQSVEPPRNLLRNSHFWFRTNGEVPDWWGTNAPELVREWTGCVSVEDSSPIQGTRALRLFNPQAGTALRWQSFAYVLPSGKPYTFSVYLRSERPDFPVTLGIGYDRRTTVLAQPVWRRFAFTATPQRGHWARGRLIVTVTIEQAGTIWLAAPQLEAGESPSDYTPLYAGDVLLPPRAQPLRAIVECDAYATESQFRLWCESNLSVPVTVRCRLGDNWLKPMGDATLPPNMRRFVPFSLAEVPIGTHVLTVETVTTQGEVVATTTDRLTKLTPPSSGAFVQVDRVRRHLVVNGAPFVVFAQGIHASPRDWWLSDIAAHGFNAVIPMVPTDPATWATTRAFMDEAHRRGLKVIAWLRPPGDQSAAAIADAIAETVAALRDHPAVIAWYLLDEPEGWWERDGRREEELLTVYRTAKQTDPYRPAQLNWYRWTDGKGGYGSLQASDFGSLDYYPFGRVENPMGQVADVLWRMNRDCRPLGKPVAFWQQMYGYDDAVREPTADEARAHTWLTLILGGRLIYWFVYKPMSHQLWRAMPSIAAEVQKLAVLLTRPDAFERAVGREGALYYAVWDSGGATYLLAVNASYTPQRTPVFLRWLTGQDWRFLKPIATDGSATLRDGIAWAQLPPLGVGWWQLF